MISTFKLTSASVGGHNGEQAQYRASHDDQKKHQEGGHKIGRSEAEHDPSTAEYNEGRSWAQFVEDETASSDRQSRPSIEDAHQEHEKEGGPSMTDSTSPLPKTGGHVARVAGQLFNDTRITNVLMLVLVLIGMGGLEQGQAALCSL